MKRHIFLLTALLFGFLVFCSQAALATYPVVDTFSDANGTNVFGTGTSVSGSATTRTSDSGSTIQAQAGTLTAYDTHQVNGGEVHDITSHVSGGSIEYTDKPASLHSTTNTCVFNFYTSGVTTAIYMNIHHYWSLKYVPSTGVFTICDILNGFAAIGGSGTTITNGGSTSYTLGTPLTYGGSAGTKTAHTIVLTILGTSGATGFTMLQPVVDGVTLTGWTTPPAWTTGYGDTNINAGAGGFRMDGVTVGTAGAQTGIGLDQININDSAIAATGFQILGPAVTGIATISPSDLTVRTLVGGNPDGGCYKVQYTPTGATAGSNGTFTFSDDAATGAFGSCTITTGNNAAFFTYTGNTAGTRTITGVGGGVASGFTNATLSTVVSNNVVIVDGDSRSDYRSGNGATSISTNNLVVPPVLLQTRLGTTAAVYDVAVSGQTVEAQISNEATNITTPTAAIIAAGGNVTVLCWGAGNSVNPRSIAAGHTTDTTTQVGNYVETQVNSYCTTAKGANAKVIVTTDARRADTGSGFALWQGSHDATNFNLVINEINSQIRTNWKTYANGIFEWGADNRALAPAVSGNIQIDGTHFNPFNSATVDTTHTTAVGQPDFAEGAFSLIKALQNGMGTGGQKSFTFSG